MRVCLTCQHSDECDGADEDRTRCDRKASYNRKQERTFDDRSEEAENVTRESGDGE